VKKPAEKKPVEKKQESKKKSDEKPKPKTVIKQVDEVKPKTPKVIYFTNISLVHFLLDIRAIGKKRDFIFFETFFYLVFITC